MIIKSTMRFSSNCIQPTMLICIHPGSSLSQCSLFFYGFIDWTGPIKGIAHCPSYNGEVTS